MKLIFSIILLIGEVLFLGACFNTNQASVESSSAVDNTEVPTNGPVSAELTKLVIHIDELKGIKIKRPERFDELRKETGFDMGPLVTPISRIKPTPRTLTEFTENHKDRLKATSMGVEILESTDIIFAGNPGHKLVYTDEVEKLEEYPYMAGQSRLNQGAP